MATPWIWAAVAALVIAPVLISMHGQPAEPAPAATDLEPVAADLATAVGRLLRSREERWQVHDPYVLPVRWEVAAAEVHDHWANICQAPAGATATPIGLAGNLGQIAEIYLRVPSRRLVILGRAGAGKTILASCLVADLLTTSARCRGAGDHHPVRVNPQTTPLRVWVATHLIQDHPGLGSTGPVGTLADQLLTAGRIPPILDGFDEIAAGPHPAALTALNRTRSPFVVTSRPGECRAAVTAVDAKRTNGYRGDFISAQHLRFCGRLGVIAAPQPSHGSTVLFMPMTTHVSQVPGTA